MPKQRVAILGGGPAALALAWELTQATDCASRFDIDVYTLGWRLGGKCASSRNEARRWRNEEHGLHLLGGFYHNTFQQLRPLYQAWAQDFPHAVPFAQAFVPHQGFTIAQRRGDGWSPVRVNMPVRAGEPGVAPEPLDARTLLAGVWEWIAGSLRRLELCLPPLDWRVNVPVQDLLPLPEADVITARQLATDFKMFAQDLRSSGNALTGMSFSAPWLATTEKLRTFADGLPVLQGADWRQVLKFLAATSCAMLVDQVLVRGFDVVNGFEAAQWLRTRGGADDEAIACPLFQASYHYAFAYVDGNPAAKNIAAGSGMRGLLRMLFTYHGTIFQHMNGGMGEIVAVPYFEVLRKRGVRFHFFHRVEALEAQGDAVARIHLRVQARAKGGPDAYEPLVEVTMPDGRVRRCWPSEPRASELEDPAAIAGIDLESWHGSAGVGETKTLQAGTHFDACVLAIPGGVLPYVSAGLDAQRWQDMLKAIATTPTVSAQLWRHDANANYGGLSQDGLFTGYVLPHSTWADLSFQRAGETPDAQPATISIFCGPAPAPVGVPHDANFPNAERQRAETITDDWLRDDVEVALPGMASAGGYARGPEFDRYVRMNSDPVSLYVLTPAGSVDHRLRCDASGYSNLLLAGDWTRHNLDMGAVEAAVMSGRICARALCGEPGEVYGDHDVA